jgi:hypothetical protein
MNTPGSAPILKLHIYSVIKKKIGRVKPLPIKWNTFLDAWKPAWYLPASTGMGWHEWNTSDRTTTVVHF